MELKTPIQLLEAEKERLYKEGIISGTKERNKIKKLIPVYEKAIKALAQINNELL